MASQEVDFKAKDVNDLIREKIKLVNWVIKRYKPIPYRVDYDDLLSWGLEGLWRSIDNYDPNRSASQITHFRYWITWTAGRNYHELQGKRLKTKYKIVSLDDLVKKARHDKRILAGVAGIHGFDGLIPSSFGKEESRIVSDIDSKRLVKIILGSLTEQKHEFVLLHYFCDLDVKEIGPIMGVTKFRVYQLRQEVIREARGILGRYFENRVKIQNAM